MKTFKPIFSESYRSFSHSKIWSIVFVHNSLTLQYVAHAKVDPEFGKGERKGETENKKAF